MSGGNCGRAVPGVSGWGLFTLLLALLGAFSTILNGVQTLNGLFCFVTVRPESYVRETYVQSFAISGFGHNHHHIVLNSTCIDIDNFVDRELYPFCEKRIIIPDPGDREFTLESLGYRCSQSIHGNGNIRTYSYILDVNCTRSSQKSSRTFQLSSTPGSVAMTGVQGDFYGRIGRAVVQVERCSLCQSLYVIFSSICAAVTMTIFVLRALMRTCFVHFSFRLSESVHFNWVYKEVLEKYGFFSFYNPYMNEPYNLVKGEKFYVMKSQTGDAIDTESGGHGSGSEDVELFAWNSSNSVYKFTFDNGEVHAYSKDHSGYERIREANLEGPVASVIREYLKLKSQAVCVTNAEKSHFLTLGECCKQAKDGFKLEEEISDNDYQIYGRKQIDLKSIVRLPLVGFERLRGILLLSVMELMFRCYNN